MSRELDYNRELIYMLNQVRYEMRLNPLILGGSSGSGGGTTGAPGGVVGKLSQRNVSGDTTESFLFSSGSPSSLLDNLNNIRGWLTPSHNFWADTADPEDATLIISSGSWWYEDGKPPLYYTGGITPSISAPSSDSRFDLLTINDSGTLAWTSSAEGNPPDYPTAFPTASSKQLPLWMVLSRSSGSCIKRYDDGVSHYIYRDVRPYLGAPTYTPSSGSSYIGYQWYASGSLSTTTDLEGVYYIADNFTLKGSYAYVSTTPSSGSLVADIEYSDNNGVSWSSIYSGAKLEILSGDNFGSRTPDALVLTSGTIIRAAIDDVGGGDADTLSVNLYGTIQSASGGGTVTTVSVIGNDGISSSVANPTTTPSITLGLGDITPDSVTATGTVAGSNLSGTNTGDQTITLTGDATGSGTASITVTLEDTGVVAGEYSNSTISVDSKGRVLSASSGSGSAIYPSTPEDVADTAAQGGSNFAAAGDHVHRGLHSISTPGGTFIYGDAVLVPYAGVTIEQSSGSLILGASSGSASLYPDAAEDVAATASAGASGFASRGDHVHRGVTSITKDSAIYGNVTLAAGSNMTLTQDGSTITFASTAGGAGTGYSGGRLSLVNNNPVGETNSSGSLYYMPYLTNSIELYSDSAWSYISFSTTSIHLGGLDADTNYDVFAYNDGGTLALETVAWSANDTRSTALDFVAQNRLIKSGDATRRYIGSFRMNGDGSTSQDNSSYRYVWNYFNRVNRPVYIYSDGEHSYETQSWQDWNTDDTLNVGILIGYATAYNAEESQFLLSIVSDANGGDGLGAFVALSKDGEDDSVRIVTNYSPYRLCFGTAYLYDCGTNHFGYSLFQVREAGDTDCYFNTVQVSGLIRA